MCTLREKTTLANVLCRNSIRKEAMPISSLYFFHEIKGRQNKGKKIKKPLTQRTNTIGKKQAVANADLMTGENCAERKSLMPHKR
jgi:hypothetical protein